MAIIYSYPSKPTPSLSDQVLITDSASSDPENATRNTTIGEVLDQKGTGTAGTIPKWSSDGSTLTDSIIKDQGGVDVLIPRFIKHDGDTNNLFGFNDTGKFLVSVDVTAEDQFSVAKDAIIMKTDSGTKVAAGPGGVTLYSDTSLTDDATSVARFATTTTGAIVYGQTVAAGAASERGGIIRYYNNANDRYVGIAGPITQGTNYQIRLPDTIGAVGQVLAIASIDGSNAVMEWADNAGGRTCALTVTSTVTNETIPGADDGAVSIDISGGFANYAVVITHTDGTTWSNTSSSTPVGIPNLKSGTWTITGDDNEPSGETKCPITGTFSVQAGTCSLASSVSQITNATDVTVENGSVKATFTGYLFSVNMTLTDTEGKYATQTFSGITNTFTGLGVGTWTLTGTDSVNGCTSSPVSFSISPDLSIAIQSTGVNYIPGDVYSMRTTKGTGTGMQITCDSDGSNPVIVVAGDGGYATGDDVEANANVTTPASPPDTIAAYSVTNLK
jgi:hypothetical protein